MTVKRCRLCHDLFVNPDEPLPLQALEHYLTEHPGSELFATVISGISVEGRCEGCGTLFITGVTPASEGLTVPVYCQSCTDANPWDAIYTKHVSPREVIRNRVAGTSTAGPRGRTATSERGTTSP